jgi:hypothetical protein
VSETIEGVLAAAAFAAVVGVGLHRFGGKDWRPWALPMGLAVGIGGTGYALYLPSWMSAAAFLAVLYVFHRKLDAGIRSVARNIRRLEVPGCGVFETLPDPGEGPAAAWSFEGMSVFLELGGESDDEFKLTLRAEAPRAMPGIMVCHSPGAQGEAPRILEGTEPLQGLPGLGAGMAVRALPADYGFRMLDDKTAAAVEGILALCRQDREVFIHLSGPRVRVVSSGVFDEAEFRLLLAAVGRIFRRVRDVGVEIV